VDITQLILDDHHEQRRLFAMLEQIDRTDTEALAALWGRLGTFLELHAAAEEKIFYPALLQVGLAARRAAGVEAETLDAIGDHNEIRDAVAEVANHQVGTDGWFAAVAEANLANSDHMAEEEREGLTDFRRLAGLTQRHELAVAFATFEARNYAGVPAVDRDPATYVREEEEELAPRPAGSLTIGSLKGRLPRNRGQSDRDVPTAKGRGRQACAGTARCVGYVRGMGVNRAAGTIPSATVLHLTASWAATNSEDSTSNR
jgi:Hemerythrin HHE cation binding domain